MNPVDYHAIRLHNHDALILKPTTNNHTQEILYKRHHTFTQSK